MIIDVNKKDDVVVLKLSSGEEIIGRYQEENADGIDLRKPLSMAMTQNGPAMAPYFACVDVMEITGSIKFNKSLVVAITKPHKNFSDAYMQATTGIDVSATGTGSSLIT